MASDIDTNWRGAAIDKAEGWRLAGMEWRIGARLYPLSVSVSDLGALEEEVGDECVAPLYSHRRMRRTPLLSLTNLMVSSSSWGRQRHGLPTFFPATNEKHHA